MGKRSKNALKLKKVEVGEEEVQTTVQDGDGYVVEKIVDERMEAGRLEFFLKWKGYSDTENTWEPAENLDCPELLVEFNNSKKQANKDLSSSETESLKRKAEAAEANTSLNKILKTKSKKRKGTGGATKSIQDEVEKSTTETELEINGLDQVTGFERGLEAEKILGATEVDNEIHFLIKWKGSDDADLVLAKEANIKCPQTVISFYEERVTWIQKSDEEISKDD